MRQTKTRTPSRLQAELQQRKPFRSLHHEGSVGIVRTADLVRRLAAQMVEPHHITPQQYNVLRILRGAGASGLPTLAIAERMIEQTPGITRLLDRLEKKGLVRRERCATDRRQVLCEISPAGLAVLETLDEPVELAHKKLLGRLPTRDLKVLIRILDAVRMEVS